jgi:hypothetical protein
LECVEVLAALLTRILVSWHELRCSCVQATVGSLH